MSWLPGLVQTFPKALFLRTKSRHAHHLFNMFQPCQRRGDTYQLAPLRTIIASENERRFDNRCQAVRLSGTGLPCPCVHEAPAHSITLVAFDKIIQTIKALQANGINLIASCTAFACRYVGHAGFCKSINFANILKSS